MEDDKEKVRAYTYLRYMRDGTVEEKHAVVRSRSANKKRKKEKTVVQDN